RDEQLEALGRLHFLPLEMLVDALDRLSQLALAVRLRQTTDRDLCCPGIGMSGRKQRRNALLLGGPGEMNAGLLLAQPHVAEDQMDFLALEDFQRFVEVVDRGDDVITGLAEEILIVERGQRLVLDDEDPLDDLLTLPEQHRYSAPMTSPPQRTKRASVPHPRTGRR